MGHSLLSNTTGGNREARVRPLHLVLNARSRPVRSRAAREVSIGIGVWQHILKWIANPSDQSLAEGFFDVADQTTKAFVAIIIPE